MTQTLAVDAGRLKVKVPADQTDGEQSAPEARLEDVLNGEFRVLLQLIAAAQDRPIASESGNTGNKLSHSSYSNCFCTHLTKQSRISLKFFVILLTTAPRQDRQLVTTTCV